MDPVTAIGLVSQTLRLAASTAEYIGILQRGFRDKPQEVESVPILNFRSIHANRILSLQNQLAVSAVGLEAGRGPDPARNRPTPEEEQFDLLLHAYANAIRDYETLSQEIIPYRVFEPKMTTLLRTRLFNPEKYEQLQERADMLKHAKLSGRQWEIDELSFRELNREVRVERERREAYWDRLWMGSFGGLALIGPMLLMVLHRDINTSLITTSVATALFVIVLTLMGQSWGGKDVLAATAAYAAVLVVFVGTSMT